MSFPYPSCPFLSLPRFWLAGLSPIVDPASASTLPITILLPQGPYARNNSIKVDGFDASRSSGSSCDPIRCTRGTWFSQLRVRCYHRATIDNLHGMRQVLHLYRFPNIQTFQMSFMGRRSRVIPLIAHAPTSDWNIS